MKIMTEDEIKEFVRKIYDGGKSPSEHFGITEKDLSDLEEKLKEHENY